MKIFNYHKTLNTLPIYYYDMFNNTGDYRYLLVLDRYDDLPEYESIRKRRLFKDDIIIENFNKDDLKKAWKAMQCDFEEGTIDINIIRLKEKMWSLYWEYMTNRSLQKYNNSFAAYRHEIDRNVKVVYLGDRFFYEASKDKFDEYFLAELIDFRNKEYKRVLELYNDIRSKIGTEKILKIRPYIIDFSEKEYENSISLIDEAANIEDILKGTIKIDIYECSTKKYLAYKKKAISIIKQHKANEAKKKLSKKNK